MPQQHMLWTTDRLTWEENQFPGHFNVSCNALAFLDDTAVAAVDSASRALHSSTASFKHSSLPWTCRPHQSRACSPGPMRNGKCTLINDPTKLAAPGMLSVRMHSDSSVRELTQGHFQVVVTDGASLTAVDGGTEKKDNAIQTARKPLIVLPMDNAGDEGNKATTQQPTEPQNEQPKDDHDGAGNGVSKGVEEG
eukprot:2025577-Pleurochrysis_carterae.AAC.1